MNPMNDQHYTDIKAKLRSALPSAQKTELDRDLWPAMLQRLSRSPVRVPWFDWLLGAAATAALIFFPGLIPALLYHF